jgi:hypothetical protein
MKANHTTITHYYDGDGPVSQAPGCMALIFDVACFLFFLMIVGFFFWMQ